MQNSLTPRNKLSFGIIRFLVGFVLNMDECLNDDDDEEDHRVSPDCSGVWLKGFSGYPRGPDTSVLQVPGFPSGQCPGVNGISLAFIAGSGGGPEPEGVIPIAVPADPGPWTVGQ
jgi:hypothetical protein